MRVLAERRYDVLHFHGEAVFFAARLARRHGLKHVDVRRRMQAA